MLPGPSPGDLATSLVIGFQIRKLAQFSNWTNDNWPLIEMTAFSLLLLCSFLLLIILSSTLGFSSICSCSPDHLHHSLWSGALGCLSDIASHYGNCSPLASSGQVLPPALYYFQDPFPIAVSKPSLAVPLLNFTAYSWWPWWMLCPLNCLVQYNPQVGLLTSHKLLILVFFPLSFKTPSFTIGQGISKILGGIHSDAPIQAFLVQGFPS